MKKQNIDIFVLIVMSVVLFGCKQEQKTGQQEVAEEEAECEVVNRVGIYALPVIMKWITPKTWWHILILFAGKVLMWLRTLMKRKIP